MLAIEDRCPALCSDPTITALATTRGVTAAEVVFDLLKTEVLCYRPAGDRRGAEIFEAAFVLGEYEYLGGSQEAYQERQRIMLRAGHGTDTSEPGFERRRGDLWAEWSRYHLLEVRLPVVVRRLLNRAAALAALDDVRPASA